MLLQTNSYVVPKDRRAEHARLLRRFRQTLVRLGCDQFEVYEQAGQNWGTADTSGRFVQIMKFRDRRHQLAVQAAERNDTQAQQLIAEFCELINFPYQQQHGLFAVGFYHSVLPVGPHRPTAAYPEEAAEVGHDERTAAQASAAAVAASEVAPPDQQTYVAAAQPAAEFSGQAVPPEEEPVTPPAMQAVAEESAAPDQPLTEQAAPSDEDVAPPPLAAQDATAAAEPDEFRHEMEALGSALEHEPMSPVEELSPAQGESDLPSPDVELSQDREQPIEAVDDLERTGPASGNGDVASHNGDSHPAEMDTVVADEIRRPDSGDTNGVFDSLLDETFEPGTDAADSGHGNPSPEAAPPESGSGIGAVLDGLDDADLDVALPAELIEDELEHAPDARPNAGGHTGEHA